MKIKELIEKLTQFNQDAEVIVVYEKAKKLFFKTMDNIELSNNVTFNKEKSKLETNQSLVLLDIGSVN